MPPKFKTNLEFVCMLNPRTKRKGLPRSFHIPTPKLKVPFFRYFFHFIFVCGRAHYSSEVPGLERRESCTVSTRKVGAGGSCLHLWSFIVEFASDARALLTTICFFVSENLLFYLSLFKLKYKRVNCYPQEISRTFAATESSS